MDLLGVLERVRLDPNSGCWVFHGTISDSGYGLMKPPGRTRWVRVHRYVYEQLVGPIPDGLQIDHVKEKGCTSKACCNPDHLEPVTSRENTARGNAPSASIIRLGVCQRGHVMTPDNIYTYPKGNRRCRSCQDMHRKAHHARLKLKRRSGS